MAKKRKVSHLKVVLFDMKATIKDPVGISGSRIMINTNTNTAYHMNSNLDRLVISGRIFNVVFAKGEDYKKWCSNNKVKLDDRPPLDNEVF